jgi:hypothetical protein
MLQVEVFVGSGVDDHARDEEGDSTSRRVYFLAARSLGSARFWPDFVHNHTFWQEEDAVRFLARVVSRIGDSKGRVAWKRLATSPHWARNTSPDPLDALEPFGDEWQREQDERRYG